MGALRQSSWIHQTGRPSKSRLQVLPTDWRPGHPRRPSLEGGRSKKCSRLERPGALGIYPQSCQLWQGWGSQKEQGSGQPAHPKPPGGHRGLCIFLSERRGGLPRVTRFQGYGRDQNGIKSREERETGRCEKGKETEWCGVGEGRSCPNRTSLPFFFTRISPKCFPYSVSSLFSVKG